MNKQFLCYIDSMSMTQDIQCPDGLSTKLPSNGFSDALISLCSEKDNYNVHFFGNEHYINGVIDQVKDSEMRVYSANKIEIEVN